MAKTFLSIVSLLLLIFNPLESKSQTLNGGVLGPGNLHIQNAQVSFLKIKTSTLTDEKGHFSIDYTSCEGDSIIVKAEGYEIMVLPADKFVPGNTAVIHLEFTKPKKVKRWFWQRWFSKD